MARFQPVRQQAFLLIPAIGISVCVAGQTARAAEQPISPGDRLNVNVVGEPDLTRVYIVDAEGDIVVPLVGKIGVKGQGPAMVREELAKRLTRFVRNPQVNVEFAERASITVGFTGMVGKAGPVTLKKGARLLDGLAQAQGVTPDADTQFVRLQRRGEAVARAMDLRKLLSGDATLNVELEDGDAVYVPPLPQHTIRVLGAVNKPGDLQRREQVTLLDAVLTTGGLTADADKRKVQVLRKGSQTPEAVNLDDVLSGRGANLVLKDGDVVTIPALARVRVKVFGSVAKPGDADLQVGATLLEAITASGGFGMDADRTAVIVTLPNGDTRRVNLEMINGPDGALPLPDGARISVAPQTVFRVAVAGGVNQPGLYPLPQDGKGQLYLTDAIALAGGMVPRAKKKNVVLIRKNPQGGQPVMKQIDFEALLKKKDPLLNMQLQANDVVYVDVEPEKDQRPNTLERILGIAGAFVGF